ncbi:rho-related GTP-binding protein RhoD isoform X1 [Tenrec ecaudatus]|uniref:rho-related GTP-binding protein RhoD isoform X1 n=1 Tax=Tenrec ecaudatus TaxID=94439 RepID=UPI003F59FF7F
MDAAQPADDQGPPGLRSAKVVLVGDGGCGKTSLLMVFTQGNFPEETGRAGTKAQPPAHKDQSNSMAQGLVLRSAPCQQCYWGVSSDPFPTLCVGTCCPVLQDYTPTVFERYSVTLQVRGKPVRLHLWDTAGQDDYDRMRPLFYTEASVLLLCFDVTNPHSFHNVSERWYPEVSHFCKETPIVVVGCKTDLRKDKKMVNKLRKKRLEPVTYHRGQEMARSVGAVTYLECSARLQENIHSVFEEAAAVALSSRTQNFWRRIKQSPCVLT